MPPRGSRSRRLLTQLAIATVLGLGTTIVTIWATTIVSPHIPLQVDRRGGLFRTRANDSLIVDFVQVWSFGTLRRCVRFTEASSNPVKNPLATYASDLYAAKGKPSRRHWPWGEYDGNFKPIQPSNAKRYSDAPFAPGVTTLLEEARGWPCYALCWTAERSSAISRGGKAWSLRHAIELPPDTRSKSIANIRALPLRPIWPGLIINSLLYAALWRLLFTTTSRIRRHLRAKNHRCPTCNYDLRNLPTTTCPECGTQS